MIPFVIGRPFRDWTSLITFKVISHFLHVYVIVYLFNGCSGDKVLATCNHEHLYKRFF